MNIILNASLWFLCTFMMGADQDSVLNVRVLLESYPIQEDIGIEFFSKNGIIITCSREPYKKYFFDDLVTTTLVDQALFINQKQNDSQILRVEPINGLVEFNGNTYSGTFYIYRTQKTLDIINILPLEDYIYCVLNTEGWPGWPKEVYKVFAVACRSYLLHQLRQAKKQKRHYHIGATTLHQAYRGTHTNVTIKQAVDETLGIFLGYCNEPILAMFDACCGGIIPAKIRNGINYIQAPYLARSYACNYCKNFKIFNWSKAISTTKLLPLLQKYIPDLESIDDIYEITDTAGVVQKIKIMEDDREHTIEGKKIYSLLTFIKSFAFSCQKKRNTVTFKGTGYGHHIGLCQWGARELVTQGWSYKKILKFYYPGTTFMKLYKKASLPQPEAKQEATSAPEAGQTLHEAPVTA